MIHERYIKPAPGPKLAVCRCLVEVRRAWGLSADDVSERIGCKLQTLQKFESGLRSPSLGTLIRWAAVLGYDLALTPKETGK